MTASPLRLLVATLLVALAALSAWLLLRGPSGAPAPHDPSVRADGHSAEGGDETATGLTAEADPVPQPGARTEVAGTESSDTPRVAGFVLEGRVVREIAGLVRPCDGATVAAFSPLRSDRADATPHVTATTDAEGQFRIELGQPQRIELVARAAAAIARERILAWPGRDDRITGLELVLVDAHTQHARVVDPARQPLAGIEVRCASAGPARGRRPGVHPQTSVAPLRDVWLSSDSDGRVSLERATAGPWTLTARDGRRVGTAQVEVPAAHVVEIVLGDADPEPPTLRAFGLVVGPDGGPVGDAEVHVLLDHEARARTDDRGEFELRLPRGDAECALLVAAPGFGVAHETLSIVGSADVGPLIVRLQTERAIAGRLLDAAGQPVAGKVVALEGDPEFFTSFVPPPTLLSQFNLTRVQTDADGAFRFRRLPDGEFAVVCRDGIETAFAAAVRAGTEDLVLQFGTASGPHVEWQVTVRDDVTSRVIPGAAISVGRVRISGGGVFTYGGADALTGDDGVGTLRALLPAEGVQHELSARAPGYAPAKREPEVYRPGPHWLEIRLAPERSLQLEVRDASGAGVDGANVWVRDANGRNLILRTGQGMGQSPVQTGPSGLVSLHGLPAGILTVRVVLEGPILFDTDVDLSRERTEPFVVQAPQ